MSKQANVPLTGGNAFVGFRKIRTTRGRMGLPLGEYFYQVVRPGGKMDELTVEEFGDEFGNAGLTAVMRWEQDQL